MAYSLQAVIGAIDLLSATVRRHPAATLVPLRQGLALVPMTDALFDALTDGASSDSLGFWKLPGGFGRVLATLSATSPVAYVEAEYFGGVGRQRAAVWAHSSLALGPLAEGDDEDESVRPLNGPISRTLAFLGAVHGNHYDEFDAVGLNRHRKTNGWQR